MVQATQTILPYRVKPTVDGCLFQVISNQREEGLSNQTIAEMKKEIRGSRVTRVTVRCIRFKYRDHCWFNRELIAVA